MFPEDRQLPNMRELKLNIAWLEESETMQQVVSACPGLQHLSIWSYGGHDIGGIPASSWAASLGTLGALSALTYLSMFTIDVAMTGEVFGAISRLRHLRELDLEGLDPNELGFAVQLAACRQLTRLHVHGMEDVDVDATNEVRGLCMYVSRQQRQLQLCRAHNNKQGVLVSRRRHAL